MFVESVVISGRKLNPRFDWPQITGSPLRFDGISYFKLLVIHLIHQFKARHWHQNGLGTKPDCFPTAAAGSRSTSPSHWSLQQIAAWRHLILIRESFKGDLPALVLTELGPEPCCLTQRSEFSSLPKNVFAVDLYIILYLFMLLRHLLNMWPENHFVLKDTPISCHISDPLTPELLSSCR